MNLLRNEARRLRRKYLKKVRHRDFNYHAYDRWLDWEYAKTFIPLTPWFVTSYVTGRTDTATVLFWAGASLSVFWFCFLTGVWVSVAVRLADKRYMLVTRKHLSKEYSE